MTYVDNKENQNFERVQTETPMYTPTPLPNNCYTNIPTSMVCSMEEGVMRRLKSFENEKEVIDIGERHI